MNRQEDREGSWRPAPYPPEIYAFRISAIRALAALKEALEEHGFQGEANRVAEVIEAIYNLLPTPQEPER
ncbi:MAG: hypothetical protein HY347_09185 [candidate division NC10 bacterium]|nr:hypothetical protein [candidate division NC10 bacterium]